MRRWIVRLIAMSALFVIAALGAPAAAGGGCKTPAGTAEGTGETVSIKNCSFGPTILHAPVGATVTWVNDDYLPHAVNGLGWDAISPYTSANPGARLSHTFDAPGIYPYMCYVHPGMSGVIVVGESGALAAAASSAPAPQTPRADAASSPLATLFGLGVFAVGAIAGYAASLVRWLRPRLPLSA